jgi:hypothetical protein
MLTDDEIRAIRHGNGPAIREICTRLLSAEAKVKALEDALRPLVGARWGHDEDGWLLVKGVSHDELDRARTALQEQSK